MATFFSTGAGLGVYLFVKPFLTGAVWDPTTVVAAAAVAGADPNAFAADVTIGYR